MHTVRVQASSEYTITIEDGLIESTGERFAQALSPCKAAVITDDVVNALLGNVVRSSLQSAGFEVCVFAFPNGERSKTMETLCAILEFLGEQKLTKSDLVVALGGGVVGDIAGFAAAVYARGVRFAQIPTTLLAAVDSSVGGKTAVNLASGKNLAGAFKQPELVLCDTGVLAKLPAHLVQDGIAEIVKYGILADPTLFELAERGALMEELENVVTRCVRIKRDYVANDEFDEGKRQELNLGHTLGHAVEKLSGFTISHGCAVAIGTLAIAKAAFRIGAAKENIAPRVERALIANGLPTACPYAAEELAEAALSDKKRRGGEITLVVPERIGACKLMRVPVGELVQWAKAGLAQ